MRQHLQSWRPSHHPSRGRPACDRMMLHHSARNVLLRSFRSTKWGTRTIMPQNRSSRDDDFPDFSSLQGLCMSDNQLGNRRCMLQITDPLEKTITLTVGSPISGSEQERYPCRACCPGRFVIRILQRHSLSHKAICSSQREHPVDVALQGLTFSCQFPLSYSPHHSAPPHAYPSHLPTSRCCLIPINAAKLGPGNALSAKALWRFELAGGRMSYQLSKAQAQRWPYPRARVKGPSAPADI